MLKTIRCCLLVITVLMSHSWAEDTITTDITIGVKQTLSSEILQEAREIQIYLPPSYDKYPNQRYPVIYVLDGENNFHYLTGFVDKLSKAPYPSIPEMIVVGIVNTDRSRDLTPTEQTKSPQNEGQRINGPTGGNLAFFNFLNNEVMPMVEKQYRTTGFNILIGHSFGGITALNHMLNGKDVFQAYIVHDPSVWWDHAVMLQRFKDAKGKGFTQKKLFLTQVDDSENTDNLNDHYQGIQQLHAYLQSSPFANLQYQYAQYEGEDHGSVPLKGNLDGLRYVFAGMRINIKAIPENPNLVKEQYTKLSETLNFQFQPSEPYLDAVLKYLERIDNPEALKQFQNYVKEIYPANTNL